MAHMPTVQPQLVTSTGGWDEKQLRHRGALQWTLQGQMGPLEHFHGRLRRLAALRNLHVELMVGVLLYGRIDGRLVPARVAVHKGQVLFAGLPLAEEDSASARCLLRLAHHQHTRCGMIELVAGPDFITRGASPLEPVGHGELPVVLVALGAGHVHPHIVGLVDHHVALALVHHLDGPFQTPRLVGYQPVCLLNREGAVLYEEVELVEPGEHFIFHMQIPHTGEPTHCGSDHLSRHSRQLESLDTICCLFSR
mmetsp:Transcript_18237/g.51936  ORF Transcript_18237/g.51936 Transcript_18237/m.51936 type:complete len:252 (-) Transcript_18237:273-1028(-)